MQSSSKTNIINWLKQNPNQFSFDENGTLLITPEKKSAQQLDFYVVREERELSTKLLFPEDRIIRKPLIPWIEQLLLKLKKISRAYELAEVFNQAAFMFCAMGEIDQARELCYSQINLFLEAFPVLTYQPWINLCRIDRIEKNYADALNKIAILNEIPATQLEEHFAMWQVIKTCRLLEPIKIYLDAKNYLELLIFTKKINGPHPWFVDEANIIAFANSGQQLKSYALIKECLDRAPPLYLPIFFFRECELIRETDQLLTLSNFCYEILNEGKISINKIFYIIQSTQVLARTTQHAAVQPLLLGCLRAAQRQEDEILQVECILKLYQLDRDKLYWQNALMPLQASGYRFIQKKLPLFDLNPILNPQLQIRAECLYDQLMSTLIHPSCY